MAKKTSGKRGKSAKGGRKVSAVDAARSIRRFLLYCCIAIAALAIFIIIFPLVKPLETEEPRAAAKDGNFITLDNGVTLHYYEAGGGAPVLLVHGFLSWGYTWKETIPALAAAGFHVLAPDLPGYGFSDKPAGMNYTYETFSDALARFLDVKKIGRATLIGNSMGGGVSIRFAIDRPGRVDKLVLVDSAGVKHGRNALFEMLTVPGLNRFMSSLMTPGVMTAILKTTMFYDGKPVTAEKAEMYIAPMRTRGSFDAALKTLTGNKFDFSDDEFKRIKAPVLMVWGERDKVINAGVATAFHGKIGGAKLVMIPKCGHLPQEEKPDEFNKIVIDFLK
jgi:pimeloyl-ACP methyl ester carboxylesterase